MINDLTGLKIGDYVRYKGNDVEILKKFTSMLKGYQLLVKLNDNKEKWISIKDLDENIDNESQNETK